VTKKEEGSSVEAREVETLQKELAEVRQRYAADMAELHGEVSQLQAKLDAAAAQEASRLQEIAALKRDSAELADKDAALRESQKKVAELELRLATAEASPERVARDQDQELRSPGGPASDEFNLPDFVWNCGNSQVMEYVQKLVSDNAMLKRHHGSPEVPDIGSIGDQSEGAVKEFPLSSALFDTSDVNVDRAMAFLSTISDSDGHQIPPLLTLLVDHADNVQVCFKVCAALENLTFTDADNRRAIVKQDGIEKMLRFMEQYQDGNAAFLRPAVDAIWNVTFEDEAVDRMAAGGLLERFLAVVQKRLDASEVQAGACAVLLNLAVKEQNRWKIVQLGGVAHMAAAMQQHSQCEEILEQGCQALYMLAYHQDLRPLVQSKCGDAATLAVSYPHGARAQKWGRWLQEVLAC
jgi:hypothetical protein